VIRRGVEWAGLGGWGRVHGKNTGIGGLVLRDFWLFGVVAVVCLGCCGCGWVLGFLLFRHRGLLRSTCALPSRRAITRLICGTALTPYTSDTLTAIDHSPSRYTSVATLAASPQPTPRGFGIGSSPSLRPGYTGVVCSGTHRLLYYLSHLL